MKDIQELLKQKEVRMQQLRAEIEALRLVAPLLGEPMAAAAGAGSSVAASSPARPDNKVDLASFLSEAGS
jgi:hypothetical protein